VLQLNNRELFTHAPVDDLIILFNTVESLHQQSFDASWKLGQFNMLTLETHAPLPELNNDPGLLPHQQSLVASTLSLQFNTIELLLHAPDDAFNNLPGLVPHQHEFVAYLLDTHWSYMVPYEHAPVFFGRRLPDDDLSVEL